MEDYKPHPDDPTVLLTRDPALINPLMQNPDVAVVILERPGFRPVYADLYKREVRGLFAEFNYATNEHKGFGIQITIRDKAGVILPEPLSIMADHYERGARMKAVGLTPIWDDLCAMSGKIADLSGQSIIKGKLFQQEPTQTVYDDELTRDFHFHPGEVTAHMSTTDAAVDIVLGHTSRTLKPKQVYIYSEDEIPAGAKILKTKGADITFMKPYVIHRKSKDALILGRSVLSIYAPYTPEATL